MSRDSARRITPAEAARVLVACFEDPDGNPLSVDAQAIYDAMTEDHAESMEICGAHDWPSLLIVALNTIAEGGSQ